jgi:hypothetical protein
MSKLLYFVGFCFFCIACVFTVLAIPFFFATGWAEQKGDSYRLNFNEKNNL